MSSITYILPEPQEYSTVYPDVPCGPRKLRDTSYGETDYVFHSYYSRPTLKRIFKKVEFPNKKEGKIREVPSQNGLYEFDNQPEYDRNNEELYSEPYKCEAFSEYGIPFANADGVPADNVFYKCHDLIDADGERRFAVYPRTIKAKPGEIFCTYDAFMVDSEQNYLVEIRNDTGRSMSSEKQTFEKPFFIATKYNSYKKLICEDKTECTYQFSRLNTIYFPPGNQYVFVTIIKDMNLEGTINASVFPRSQDRYAIVDIANVNFLTNKEFNIQIKVINGTINCRINRDDDRGVTLNAGESINITASYGYITLVPEADDRGEEEINYSMTYSISLKLNKDIPDNGEKPFGGIEFKADSNGKPQTKQETLASEFNNDGHKPEKLSGLNAGQIAGIVIGVLAVIAIICVLVWFFVFHHKSDAKTPEHDSGSGQDV